MTARQPKTINEIITNTYNGDIAGDPIGCICGLDLPPALLGNVIIFEEFLFVDGDIQESENE